MKPKLSTKLIRLLDRYRHACEDRALKGSYHSAYWDEVDQEYTKARDRLFAYLAELEGRMATNG